MYLALDGQDENRLHFKVLTSFLSFFEKIAHVAGANKVEDTMS